MSQLAVSYCTLAQFNVTHNLSFITRRCHCLSIPETSYRTISKLMTMNNKNSNNKQEHHVCNSIPQLLFTSAWTESTI